MTRYLVVIFLAIFLLSGICWAQETRVSNPETGTITDADGNSATYKPNQQTGGGQIEYRFIENTIWNTTYVQISKEKEKEILDKAKKGEKIPEKYAPLAIYYYNREVLSGNDQIGNPLDDGDRFVEGWRVLIALGRQEDRINKSVADQAKKTQTTVKDESEKTRCEVKKSSGATQIVVREESQETRDFLGAKIDDLPGLLFFIMCVIVGAIIIFGRRN